MNHRGTQKIETERLILRQFSIDDAEAMFNGWAGDPEVTRFLTWPTHKSLQTTQKIIEEWRNNAILMNDYNWCLELKETGRAIGSMGVTRIDDRAEAVQLGYCISRDFWNRGLATEGLSAVIRFFFEEVGANRIEACHDIRNLASGKVMQKCGMSCEGTLRQYTACNEGLSDIKMYSILRKETVDH